MTSFNIKGGVNISGRVSAPAMTFTRDVFGSAAAQAGDRIRARSAGTITLPDTPDDSSEVLICAFSSDLNILAAGTNTVGGGSNYTIKNGSTVLFVFTSGDWRAISQGSDSSELIKSVPIICPLGGQFLLDPNEYNGWSMVGPVDDNNSQSLGAVGAEATRWAGGFCFPFDVQPVRFAAWHRINNTAALPWGWRIIAQTKTAGSSTVTEAEILRECTGTGATAVAPNDYGNTQPQFADIDLSAAAVVPAGTVIVLGVEAPTAALTNYSVQVMSGYLQFQRV